MRLASCGVQTLVLSPEGRPGSPQLATFPSCPMSDKALQGPSSCDLLPRDFRSPDGDQVMFPLMNQGGSCGLPPDLSASLPSPGGDLGIVGADGRTEQLILVPSTPAPQPGEHLPCNGCKPSVSQKPADDKVELIAVKPSELDWNILEQADNSSGSQNTVRQ